MTEESEPVVHAADSDDVLHSRPLCGIEDPNAERTYALKYVDCRACLAIIDAQPGVLAWLIEGNL